LIFANCLLGYHLCGTYFFSIAKTDGISMLPTIPHSYRSRPRILKASWYRRGRGIHVGDVVTYTHPLMPQAQGCKRVIGMPGDFVALRTPPKRGRDVDRRDVTGGELRDVLVQVPEGHCWLEGDNLEWSRDSRVFGPVPLALIQGKVVAVLWPWDGIKWLGGGLQEPLEGKHEWVVT
ncbi:peptidase S24/S26A/S26B/S26C, partial [Massariosphaeria phaeospora]